MKILRSMIINEPDCFLLPSVWNRYEATLRSQLGEADFEASARLEQISRRNACFTNALREDIWRRLSTPRKRLINLLDTMPVDGSFVKLTRACLKTTSDFDLLVATSLEWATSVHRNGDARIYVVAHLLRQCSTVQTGLDNSIMKFLASVSALPDLSMSAVYKVLAELLRSEHLSAGRFLSWLMARGKLHNRLGSDQVLKSTLCEALLMCD